MPLSPRAVSETKREHDVSNLYGPVFRDILYLNQLGSCPNISSLPDDYTPRAAKDASLMAFAQLAAMRLHASRAMISLIDGQRQHILAEATATTSLRYGSPLNASSKLWLGNVSIPRTWGVCEKLLCVDPAILASSEDGAVIINDLAQSEQHMSRTYVNGGPMSRFYAGVALTSPTRSVVGALCVFDVKPRDGLPRDDIIYLNDLAATIMEYLDTYTLRDQQRRGEQLTRGLISFSEGRNSFCGSLDSNDIKAIGKAASQGRLKDALLPCGAELAFPGKSNQDTSDKRCSVTALQESILPTNSKSMFSRAAGIMRASSDVDGVLILDASVAATGSVSGSLIESTIEPSEETGSSSEDEQYPEVNSPQKGSKLPQSLPKAGKRCQTLGFATRKESEVAGMVTPIGSLQEMDLRRLLQQFPDGKILTFLDKGAFSSEYDFEETTNGVHENFDSQNSRQRRLSNGRTQRIMKALKTAFPGVKSLAFIPFWDFERSRWFAGCLCWSTRVDRTLSPQHDLPFYKVFSHSIMNELTRLDTMATNQAKTTFLSSMSHELRSPLHGILGSIQHLQSTALDSFQVTMLNSMAACGQTLLDTVENVLDYVKTGETNRSLSSKELKGSKTICVSSKPIKIPKESNDVPDDYTCDLALGTEEVVEAMFAGETLPAITGFGRSGSITPAIPRTPQPASPVSSLRRFSRPETVSFFDRGSRGDYQARPQDSRVDSSLQRDIASDAGSDVSCQRESRFIILDIANQENWNFLVPCGSWGRILMNIVGNAFKFTKSGHVQVSLKSSDHSRGEKASVTLTIRDSGVGMSTDFLANKLFQAFSKENPHSAGTGVGLSIVRQIIENIGGTIEVSSDAQQGTQITVKLVLERSNQPQPESPQRTHFLEALPHLCGRKVCVLQKKCTSCDEHSDEVHHWQSLTRFTAALSSTLTDWLKMDVIHASDWEGQDVDVVICPELSFDRLAAIRNRRSVGKVAPATIFVAMDSLEAATMRSDARITSKESVVEIMTQPCGPYKLASILDHCLNCYESSDENVPPRRPSLSFSPVNFKRKMSIQSIDEQSDRETYSTTLSPKEEEPPIIQTAPNVNDLHSAASRPGEGDTTHVLITDDNAINRRLLVAFMRKRRIPFKEAENGLQAVEACCQQSSKYSIILMDISMPVMDGMTATRLIRENESKSNTKPCHIIALTGLTSASARLEAWTSGVDDFMTKPVDFVKLERLMAAGRFSGERNGFQGGLS